MRYALPGFKHFPPKKGADTSLNVSESQKKIPIFKVLFRNLTGLDVFLHTVHSLVITGLAEGRENYCSLTKKRHLENKTDMNKSCQLHSSKFKVSAVKTANLMKDNNAVKNPE